MVWGVDGDGTWVGKQRPSILEHSLTSSKRDIGHTCRYFGEELTVVEPRCRGGGGWEGGEEQMP